MLLLLLLFGVRVRSQDFPSPNSLLFNHHAYQYLEEDPEPTKQGPVLFPNDAPPPPRPPLIVTSRPLSESIARSELNPTPQTILNNSIASPSQVKAEFRLKPEFQPKPEFRLRPEFRLKNRFLARVKDYRPFVLSTPFPEEYSPYADVDKGGRLGGVVDNSYGDYEEHQPVLPPIYKAFANHAKQKLLKFKHKLPNAHHEKPVTEPAITHRYQHNDGRDQGETDYDHDSNYAFSYRVKDHKTGDDFSHSQHSSGSATNGEYRVRLPDGRMQIVSYTADENGYKADVRYDDEDKTVGNSIEPKYEYGRNVPHYGSNIPDYGRNVHDYGRIVPDYGRTVSDYTRNVPNYGRNVQDYQNGNHDYVQSRDFKVVSTTRSPPVKEDYNQYSDLSKEYNTDYSLEYDGKDDSYGPHKSKFASFIPKGSNLGTIVVPNVNQNLVSSSTVTPSYEELKPLFVTKKYNTPSYFKNIELSVPSTTPNPFDYDGTTEHVVIIGTPKPNLYTNIRNVPLTATPPVTTSNYVTPRNYLVSSIASLKNGQTPILSGRFIDRINKYLTFT